MPPYCPGIAFRLPRNVFYSLSLTHSSSVLIQALTELHYQFRVSPCTYYRKEKWSDAIIHYAFIAHYSSLKTELWQNIITAFVIDSYSRLCCKAMAAVAVVVLRVRL